MRKLYETSIRQQPFFGRTTFVSQRWCCVKWAALAASAVQIPIAKANPKPTASTANEKLVWSACTVNCHSRCPLRMHVQDGVIKYVETDNLGLDNYGDFHQVRAYRLLALFHLLNTNYQQRGNR
ncbi:hypothetical protein Q7358_03505 [Glaesserella parasuis]|nr:hypothetical protein [Glaesserella parasuis]